MLRVTVLEQFAVEWDGTPRRVRARKSRALLAMLALAPGHRLPRAQVCAVLWGSRAEAQARASLRQELASLRRALGEGAGAVLHADNEALWLSPDMVSVDALDISNSGHTPVRKTASDRLLADLDLNEPGWDDWVAETRRAHSERLCAAARAHAADAQARRDWAALACAADCALNESPYDETALRWRLDALAGQGDRTGALRAYTDFAARLKAEMGLEPQAETRAARDAIRADPPDAGGPSSQDIDPLRRPGVLFLPFEALSHSDEDRLLALGLCEDIRTTLACWRRFPVIGPEALGGRTGDIQTLAVGVQASYAVTGSVRRAGARARVAARLIDAVSGRELWSQSFDGELADVFDFQEQVSQRIVSQIEPEIASAAAARVVVMRPSDLTTWELMARAQDAERRGGDGYGTPEANQIQKELAHEAIARNPEYCDAWARLARCQFKDFLLGWSEDSAAALAEALHASARAVELDPQNSFARSVRAQCVLFGSQDPPGALEHAEAAVRLNPSNVSGQVMMGCVQVYCGDHALAFEHYEKALRLNPNFPNMGAVLCDMMMCRALSGQMEAAVGLARKTMSAAPKYYRGLMRCAAVLAQAGETAEACEILRRTEDVGGAFGESYILETYPFVRNADLEFLLEGLRTAGWQG